MHCGIKVNLEKCKEGLEGWCWKGAMRVAFNLNGCKKLKENSFSNIAAMEINLIFEINRTKFFITHQPGHIQI